MLDLFKTFRKVHDTSGRIPFKGRTLLSAQKKVLSPEGQLIFNQLCARVPNSQWQDVLFGLAKEKPGLWIPSGKLTIIHNRMITTAFVDFVVDQLIAEGSTFGDFKYHYSGEGTGAEDISDSGLGTPREDARVVGTQVENAHNIYESVATITYTNTWAITEHGLFNTAGAGGPPVTGGTLMDRTKFAVKNVIATNQIEFTFDVTLTPGG